MGKFFPVLISEGFLLAFNNGFLNTFLLCSNFLFLFIDFLLLPLALHVLLQHLVTTRSSQAAGGLSSGSGSGCIVQVHLELELELELKLELEQVAS